MTTYAEDNSCNVVLSVVYACPPFLKSAEQKFTRDPWRIASSPSVLRRFKSFGSRIPFLPGTREQKLVKRRRTRAQSNI